MTQASDMTSEGRESPPEAPVEGNVRPAPTTLTGQHRALDEAAAQLVAAWDVDIDARTPAEGQEALERLRPPASASSFPPAPNTPTLPAAPSSVPPAREKARTWPWLVLAGALLVAGAAIWLSGQGQGETVAGPGSVQEHTGAPGADAPSAPATKAAPAPNPANPATRPKPVVEEIPAQYGLTVRTIPRDAVLKVEGKRVSNPFKGKLDRSDSVHVVATAEGHETAERDIELHEDTHLMVTLVPEDPPETKAEAAQLRRQKAKRERMRRARKARARRAAKARRQKAARRKSSSSGAGFVSSNPYQ